MCAIRLGFSWIKGAESDLLVVGECLVGEVQASDVGLQIPVKCVDRARPIRSKLSLRSAGHYAPMPAISQSNLMAEIVAHLDGGHTPDRHEQEVSMTIAPSTMPPTRPFRLCRDQLEAKIDVDAGRVVGVNSLVALPIHKGCARDARQVDLGAVNSRKVLNDVRTDIALVFLVRPPGRCHSSS